MILIHLLSQDDCYKKTPQFRCNLKNIFIFIKKIGVQRKVLAVFSRKYCCISAMCADEQTLQSLGLIQHKYRLLSERLILNPTHLKHHSNWIIDNIPKIYDGDLPNI